MTIPASNVLPNSVAKGYWIILAKISDPSQFNQYSTKAAPLIARYGGRVIIRGDVSVVVEGEMTGKPFVIEFPSYTAAQECFHSEGYQEAMTLRTGIATFQIVIVEEFIPPQSFN